MKPADEFTDYEKEQILRVVKHLAIQSGWSQDCAAQGLTDYCEGAHRLVASLELLHLLEPLIEAYGKVLKPLIKARENRSEHPDSVGSYKDVVNSGEYNPSQHLPL